MAYPAGVVTTQLTFGTAQAMIGQDALAMTVKVTPTTNLVYGGNVFIADTKTVQVAAGGSGAVTLINPDQAGFFNGGGLAIRNWGYTFEITYSNGSAALYTAPPKIITWFASDAGPLDVDTMVPIADGSGVLVPATTVSSAVASIAALTADTAVSPLLDTATATRGKLDARYIGGSVPIEFFASSATLDVNGNVSDWIPAFNAAIAAGVKQIELKGQYYTCRTPLKVPSNYGLSIFANSAAKGAVLNFFLPAGNDNNAAIDILGMQLGTGYNYAGFNMENVQIMGNNSVAHGLRMQDLSYPWIQNCLITGFRGAGLYLDVVMDGFLNITVQGCGRTTGSYTSLADRSNNALTTFAAVLLTSYRPGSDQCNMLRITGDIEQNNVSPYLHVTGGIGLQFNDIHGETREAADANSFDFALIENAACEFNGMNLAGTLRNGFLLNGYTGTRFSGGRNINNVIHTGNNTTGELTMINVQAGNVSWSSWGGQHTISNSKVGDLTIDYAGAGPSLITKSFLGNVLIRQAGTQPSAVIVDGCVMTSYTADANTVNQFVRNSEISGALVSQGAGSRIENCGYGTLTIGSGTSFSPRRDAVYFAPTLSSGFSNLAGFAAAGYRKDSDGIVHLTGMINVPATTPASNLSIFGLPVGYRSLTARIFSVASGDAFGDVQVSADGTVNFRKGSGWVSLDGISFFAEA